MPPRKILFQQPDFLHIRPTVDLAQIQNQTKPEMVSESGNAHQVHPSPRRDNSQKMGIRQMISRITEIATLTFAAPIAWKNTGVIRENTAKKKLSPIMRGM